MGPQVLSGSSASQVTPNGSSNSPMAHPAFADLGGDLVGAEGGAGL